MVTFQTSVAAAHGRDHRGSDPSTRWEVSKTQHDSGRSDRGGDADVADRSQRPVEHAVREGRDRESVRLVVRKLDLDPVGEVLDEVDPEAAARERPPPARAAARDEESRAGEEERVEVDQVPLDDLGGEDVDRYAPLIAAYQPNETSALAATIANAVRAGSRPSPAAARATRAADQRAGRRARSRARRRPRPRTSRSGPCRAGRDLPLLRAATGDGVDHDHGADGERRRRRPSPSGSTTPASARIRSVCQPTTPRAEHEHGDERDELRADGGGDERCGERERDRPACRPESRADDQPERERRHGVRQRLLDEDRRVGERRRRDRAHRREERPGRDDAPCDPVRREDRAAITSTPRYLIVSYASGSRGSTRRAP